MSSLRHILIMTIVICCSFLAGVQPALAYRIALLPVADISEERNGVNIAATRQLITELQNYGFEVTDPQTVREYMVSHGLRRCGEIDSFSCRKMAVQLQIDALLITTIYGHSTAANQVSILATLLHGENGQAVWSSTQASHLNDKQPLFGIGATTDIGALQNKALQTVAAELHHQLPLLPEVDTSALAAAQIIDVQIHPSIVKGDTPITCRVKLDFIGSAPDSIRLISGTHKATLQRSPVTNLYVGTITSALADGKHTIDLSLSWLSAQQQFINKLCSYTVANDPAQLSLDFRTGLKIGDSYAFSDSIKIAPKLEPQRPVDLWCFTVYNKNGAKVFYEQQFSDLPLEMRWRGNDNNMRRLDNGEYTLSFFTRDIAGNEAIATSQLYLQNTDMEMVSINQNFDDGKYQLELLPSEALQVPIDNWALTLETEDGKQVFTTKGYQLPATIGIPAEVAQPGLICQFRALDKLGNHYDIADARLEVVDSAGMLAQLQPQQDWRVDF